MESRASLPKTETRLGLFIDHSYRFFFVNRSRQYIVYAIVFSVAFTYAIVSDLVFAKPELSVVVESATLAFLLLITLPITYILGSMRGGEKAVPEYVRPTEIVENAALEWATRSYLPLADLGNALNTIQSNLANQQRTQELIVKAISSFDNTNRNIPAIVREVAQTIAEIQGSKVTEQLNDVRVSLHKIAELVSGLSALRQHDFVKEFAEVMEKQNDQFAKVISEVIEKQNSQILEIMDRVTGSAGSMLRDSLFLEEVRGVVEGRKIILPGEKIAGARKSPRMFEPVRQLAVGDLLAYKDPETSVNHGTGVVRAVTDNSYSILWLKRGLVDYRRSILDEKLEQIFQRVDLLGVGSASTLDLDLRMAIDSGISPETVLPDLDPTILLGLTGLPGQMALIEAIRRLKAEGEELRKREDLPQSEER